MALDPKKLNKPLKKLRKLVRKMPKEPTQGEVHDLRTNTRRAQATLEALQLDRKRKGRRVLRAVTPIRKKAGDVRDMDVLTGFATRLAGDNDSPCLVKLLEHLGEERARGANRLHKAVAQRRKTASKRLKTCSSLIKENFGEHSSKLQNEWPVDATAAALRVSEELTNWPKLSAKNLHPFRLKVKKMRYVVQLSGKDDELTERLGKVKDQIGEWHDWTELDAIAKEVLSDCKNCNLIAQIQRTAGLKFETAVKSAQRLRSEYFAATGGSRKRSRKQISIKEPVLEAAARLAA